MDFALLGQGALATTQLLVLLSIGSLPCLHFLHKARGSETGILTSVLICITDSVCNIKQVVSARHHRFSHITETLFCWINLCLMKHLNCSGGSQCSSMKRSFVEVPVELGSMTLAIHQQYYRARALCLPQRQAYTKVKKLFIPAVIGNFCI